MIADPSCTLARAGVDFDLLYVATAVASSSGAEDLTALEPYSNDELTASHQATAQRSPCSPQ